MIFEVKPKSRDITGIRICLIGSDEISKLAIILLIDKFNSASDRKPTRNSHPILFDSGNRKVTELILLRSNYDAAVDS